MLTESKQNEIIFNHFDIAITRQFHSAVYDIESETIFVFGGYGRTRLNDVICIKYGKQIEDKTECSIKPKERMHHQMVIVKNQKKNERFLFLFGGRSNPNNAFNDCWLYCLQTQKWKKLTLKTSKSLIKLSRFRHSMCAISDNLVFVFGGIWISNKDKMQKKLLNDAIIFDIDFDSLSVKATNIANIASPRCGASIHRINASEMLIFGGLTNLNCFCDKMMANDANFYVFDFVKNECQILKAINDGPIGLYGLSHCISTDRNFLFFVGGIMNEYNAKTKVNDIKFNEYIWRFDLNSKKWKRYETKIDINIGHRLVFIKQTAKYHILCLIGGGLNVFSFGRVHSSVIELKLPKKD